MFSYSRLLDSIVSHKHSRIIIVPFAFKMATYVAFNQTFLAKVSSEVTLAHYEVILIAVCCALPGLFLALVLSSMCCNKSRELLETFISSSSDSKEEECLSEDDCNDDWQFRNEETHARY